MASDPDDNPFARNSAWPKMPQAPFRLGALPKVAPVEDAPAPATITPVFVRPAPQVAQTAQPRELSPPPRAPQATPEPPIRPPVELEPLVIQPLARSRPAAAAAGRRRGPLMAATGLGLMAVAGLGFALSRGREPPPAAQAPAPATMTIKAAPAAAAPGPLGNPDPAPAPARRLVEAGRAPDVGRPVRTAAAPPVLVLPPAEPEVITPPAAPAAADTLPAYAPPRAPDPDVPMTTRRPY